MYSDTALSRASAALFPFVLFICAALLSARADAAPGVHADEHSGCKVWISNDAADLKVSWSGACKQGYAHGHGVATWTRDGKLVARIESDRIEGRSQGRVRIENGDGSTGDAIARDGAIATGFATYTWPLAAETSISFRSLGIGRVEQGRYVVRGYWTSSDLVVECDNDASCRTLTAVQVLESEPEVIKFQGAKISPVADALIAAIARPWPRSAEMKAPCSNSALRTANESVKSKIMSKQAYLTAIGLWGNSWFPTQAPKGANCIDYAFLIRQLQRAYGQPETGELAINESDALILAVEPQLTSLLAQKAIKPEFNQPFEEEADYIRHFPQGRAERATRALSKDELTAYVDGTSKLTLEQWDQLGRIGRLDRQTMVFRAWAQNESRIESLLNDLKVEFLLEHDKDSDKWQKLQQLLDASVSGGDARPQIAGTLSEFDAAVLENMTGLQRARTKIAVR